MSSDQQNKKSYKRSLKRCSLIACHLIFHKINRLYYYYQYRASIYAEIKQAVMISNVLSQFESASVNYNENFMKILLGW